MGQGKEKNNPKNMIKKSDSEYSNKNEKVENDRKKYKILENLIPVSCY